MTLSSKVIEYYGKRYRFYHRRHPKSMQGKVPAFKVAKIAELVENQRLLLTAIKGESIALRLLDYGSGKGHQYLSARIHERWGGPMPYCWDPGVIGLGRRPEGVFDGIICTDVLEHIEARHLPAVLGDIFGYTRPYTDELPLQPFVYLHICCRPASKSFADGTNFHETVKPPDWWEGVISTYRPEKVTVVTSYEVPSAEG